MIRPPALLALLLASACSRQPAPGPAPHQIRIVGASAGLPFAADAAERFTLADADSVAPLAQANGSMAGIAALCRRPDAASPDLAIVTRNMTADERRGCATPIAVAPFGWSALAIVTGPGDGPAGLTAAQLAAALGGPATRWSDIDAALPPSAIRIYGPPEPILRGDGLLPSGPRAIRRDGGYRALGADAGLVADTVSRTPGAIGLVPYPYAARAGLRTVALDGIVPGPATIADGRYPLRSPLYLAVRTGVAPPAGLPAMLRLFARSIDPGGDFARAGLLPLDPAGRAAFRRTLASTSHAAQL